MADMRTTGQGDTISVDLLRSFITMALEHDAVRDSIDDLMYEHVVGGRYHPTIVTGSLKGFITEVLDAATTEDWRAIGEQLIADARAAL